MMFLPILLRLLPYIAAIALAGVVAWKIQHWCNTACKDARAEVVTLQAQIDTARERATALALLWADGLNKVEVKYVEVQREVRERFTTLRERAGHVRADSDGAIRLGSESVELLNDAHAAANPATSEGDNRPTQTISPVTGDAILTPEAYAAFYVDAAEAYRDAYEKWKAAVEAYEVLRNERAGTDRPVSPEPR